MDKIQYARTTLKEFVPIIDAELKKVWESEKKILNLPDEQIAALSKHILDHIEEHNLRQAKRVRAAFIYQGYKLFKEPNHPGLIPVCTSIECVHTALLIHDDFMDRDIVRRGEPTTHEYYRQYHEKNLSRGSAEHYGASMAVDAGDIALTLGYKMLNDSDFELETKSKALSYMLRAIINTGYGQAFDVTLEAMENATEDNIVNLHHAKTSIYTYQNPIHIGAILAGATEEDLEILSRYAIPGGIAFQLKDDILGLYGDEEKTGKSAFADVKEGKQTLLVVKAFELASEEDKAKLREIWGNHDITETEAQIARDIVEKCGSLEYSMQLAEKFAKKSQEAIPDMKAKGWNSEAVEFLDGIAEYMASKRDA